MDPETGTSQDESMEIDSPEIETTQDSPVEEGDPTTTAPEVSDKDLMADALSAFRDQGGKAVGAPKPPEKKIEETPTEETPETPVVPVNPQGRPKLSRSYEGLEEDEADAFKHVGNHAYSTLYPIVKGLKEQLVATKSQLESAQKSPSTSIFEMENAYEIDPQYKELNSASQRLDAEAQYWQQQLASIEAGGEFTPLSWDAATGRYSYGTPVPGSPELKAQIISAMTQSHAYKQQIQGELQRVTSSYKQQHGQFIQGLQQARQKILGNTDAATVKRLEEAAKSKASIFPENVRNHPLAKLLCEQIVVNEALGKLYREMKAKVNGKTIVQKTAKSAGPSAAEGGAGTSTKTVGSILEQFKQQGFTH